MTGMIVWIVEERWQDGPWSPHQWSYTRTVAREKARLARLNSKGYPVGYRVRPYVPREELDQMREALEGLVAQYAGWSPDGPGLSTDGIGALQCAFEALGWDDPHPYPAQCCDEPGCRERANCGWPSPTGYRQTCGEHREKGQPGVSRDDPPDRRAGQASEGEDEHAPAGRPRRGGAEGDQDGDRGAVDDPPVS